MVSRAQQGLDFAPLRPRQAGVIGGPGRGKGPCAAQAVGQMGNRQAVAFCGVVAVNGVEVAKHQKSRALRPRRGHQPRCSHKPCGAAACGQGAAIHLLQAPRHPFAERPFGFAAFTRQVQACGQLDFKAPDLRGVPSGFVQKMGGRGQRVGHAVHQVAAAVAVKVLRQALKGGGHELGMAKSTGPRADQPFGRNMPGLQNAQRGVELAAKVVLPVAKARQRAQRLGQGVFAKGLAKVAFHPPHCHHGGRVHAVLQGHFVQQRAVLDQLGLAFGHPLIVHQGSQIVPNRHAELGLVVHLVQDAHVGAQALGEPSKAVFFHACCLGRAAQAAKALLEFCLAPGRQGQRHRQQAHGPAALQKSH